MTGSITQFPQKKTIDDINAALMDQYFEKGRSVSSISRDHRRSIRGLEMLINREVKKGRQVIFPT